MRTRNLPVIQGEAVMEIKNDISNKYINFQKSHQSARLKDKLVPYLFILPFIISFFVFFAFPSIYSLVLSFFSYKGYGKANFAGFDNYISVLSYGNFWVGVKNTLFYFLMHIVPVMLFGFLFAAAMYSKLMSNVQSIFKPLLFMPQVVPIVASALAFKIIFATNVGVLNQIFGFSIQWLSDPDIMRWPVLVLIVWRATGWYMVIYLAGLTTISDEIMDASRIDGTTILQKYVHVIIPMMKPIFLFAFLIDAIGSFRIYTEPNILLGGGGGTYLNYDAAPVMNIMTDAISGGSFGMASATGWLIFIMILLISIVQYRILRERDE